MSAIDFYITVDEVKGKAGENRVVGIRLRAACIYILCSCGTVRARRQRCVRPIDGDSHRWPSNECAQWGRSLQAITMNGKFLPHVEQKAADNTAAR